MKPEPLKPNLNERLDQTEYDYVVAALKDANANIAEAARLLGITRSTLQGKMRKHRIVVEKHILGTTPNLDRLEHK